jgi:hypothetical protein
MQTTAAYRLVCAALIGSIVAIWIVASREQNPCAWNAPKGPAYVCGIVLP